MREKIVISDGFWGPLFNYIFWGAIILVLILLIFFIWKIWFKEKRDRVTMPIPIIISIIIATIIYVVIKIDFADYPKFSKIEIDSNGGWQLYNNLGISITYIESSEQREVIVIKEYHVGRYAVDFYHLEIQTEDATYEGTVGFRSDVIEAGNKLNALVLK